MDKRGNFNKNEKDKIIAQWNQSHFSTELDLYSFQPARDYFLTSVSGIVGGTAKENWFENWFIKTYLKNKIPVANCLTLCCGHGERDRRLAKMGVFQHSLGLDISPAAIKNAKKNAAIEGYANMDYKIADLNVEHLKENSYDLVYVGGGMHHIINLEHLVGEIKKSLKPGGYFVCDEYVGPSYNNLSIRHLEIINSAIHLIPERLRHASERNFIPIFWRKSLLRRALFILSHSSSAYLDNFNMPPSWASYKKWIFQLGNKLFVTRPIKNYQTNCFKYGKVFDLDPDKIKQGDPSEGIRSGEIIPIIKQRFKKTSVHYYNGSIIAYALDKKFFSNYNSNSEHDKAILELIINLEKTMIQNGEIPPIHAIVVSQKNI